MLPEIIQLHLSQEQMDSRNLKRGLVVAASLVAITVALQFSSDAPTLWRKFLQYLYFLPIVIAAFWFGWRGGVATAAVATLSYAPTLTSLTVDQAGESIDLLLIGSLLGVLADREHRKTRLLERTTAELSAAYEQLQKNVERWKQAERLSAIGQLAAGLAHEIRTPLAAIEGAADLLRSERSDAALQEEMTSILQKESKRLNRLLTEMLDYARPRRPEFRFTGLGPLADGIARLLQVQAAKKQVVVRVEVDENAPPVECDPEQIRQVLLNLALNAVQAADGPGEVVVRGGVGGTGRARITVSDHGPGISEEVRGHLFEPFYTTKNDGTGLGLAVARQIVEAHGGTIVVEANEPRGTRFVIELPLQQDKGTA